MMVGGSGADTYYVDNADDQIVEDEAEGLDAVYTVVDYVVPENIENIYLAGHSNLSVTYGPFTYTNVWGNDGDNVITRINAASYPGVTSEFTPSSVMRGGVGDDTYYPASFHYEQIIENPGEGTDTVILRALESVFADSGNPLKYYRAPANVENLFVADDALATDNFELYGGPSANWLRGGPGQDRLHNVGANDILEGGTNADIYFVNDPSTVIIEQPGEGLDTVAVSFDYTLPDNFENIAASLNDPYTLNQTPHYGLTLTGNSAPNHLTGGAGDDVLDGSGGGDLMRGKTQNDTYYVDDPNDQVLERPGEGTDTIYTSISMSLFTGFNRMPDNVEIIYGLGTDDLEFITNSKSNSLIGNSGDNNFIDDVSPWTIGLHRLFGGEGNDTYHISFGVTTVIEQADEGIDTIYSDYRSNDTQHLPDNVENLVYGQSGSGNCVIIGNDLDNSLIAGNSTDRIDGGAGADYMEGKAGGDTYYVDNAGDAVVELAGQGLDTVYASIDYTLPNNVEIGILTGTAQTLIGNSGSNHLTGNAADNILDGDGGTDRYTGGGGADTFRFDGAFGGDVITDFVRGADVIDFSGSDNVHAFGDISQTFYGDDILIRDAFYEAIWVLDQMALLDQTDFFFGVV